MRARSRTWETPDGAAGSAGFLCEAFEYLKAKQNLSTNDMKTLQKKTFYGKEKKSLAYIIGTMNMILHGIEAPNIIHNNTLSENISDIQEKDRFNVILANPTFGGKERKEVQQNLFVKLPDFFKDEDELRKIWSVPSTRNALLESLEEAGYGKDELSTLQKLVNAENSDIFDVFEYVSFAVQPISREERVAIARPFIFNGLNQDQKDFLEFVLSKYIETGVDELDQEKLLDLLSLKYYQ